MLWPQQQLHETQSPQLQADASSRAFWLEAYSRQQLAALPGSSDDSFGGQLVTQERLGERWGGGKGVTYCRGLVGFEDVGGV